MRRWFLLMAVLGLGCGGTDPSKVDLTGQWETTLNSIGIRTVTLNLVERENQLTATGEWTAQAAGIGPYAVTGTGLRFGSDINLNLSFATNGEPNLITTEGSVDGADRFHLVFPTLNDPVRAAFRRR